ncbi:MAG: serine/threonine-protein kinase PknK, partial [Hyphomicrobiales bacterium]|nr:serine/threonine-protein kinase PknK [Hyphomicrobiales bacterium]
MGDPQVLLDDGEHVLCRGRRLGPDGGLAAVLMALPTVEHAPPTALDRLAHEYELTDELHPAWAARPIELLLEDGQTMLVLEDPGGEPLQRLIGAPMEPGRFLRLAIDVASALAKAHQRGLVHKDIKPANILVNCADGGARLTGFGIASRLPRERQAPEPPEVIAGTLAYMAPEQTGRMNRSVDSRSDLYALGVTFYLMLTGQLPFSAADPMEWVHCHIARKPAPPAERLASVPALISEIVIKLMAKTAEHRYQTAAGLAHDLRRCLDQWERDGRIEPFPLGARDAPDRLLIPEKLYGREREIEALLAAFDRVVATDAPELVLVSGYSGIGKSSVVNELHKALVPPRGLFVSGKFDLLKRDIPYATLAQAFQNLVRGLLGKPDAELARWRSALLEALGPNGRLIADLVPELTLIIGEQPPVPELEPQQAKGRFQLVFRRFIGVLATAEHPLALFLDDLQWLDAATLDLIEDLLTQPDVRHLMLVGACRDNEVDAAHPLMRKLVTIRSSGARIGEIELGPLDNENTTQLIADALRSTPEDVAPLAQLVQAKTAGNPFFVLRFLHALADEELLAFDPARGRWSWDLDRIHAKGYSDNVVELMVGRLGRLPLEARNALQEFAAVGNIAEFATLAIVLGTSGDDVHAALSQAVRLDLVERAPGSYRFIHDRVQEAAYSLIPEDERPAAHLRIGRLLAAQTPPEKREESIFDIVGQLNRGAALIGSQEERQQLAEINLTAGKRAKASAAYASALAYFAAGAALLAGDCWERRHELIFHLELHRAECEFLTGALAEAEQRLTSLSQRAANAVERATVACLRIELNEALDKSDRAVGIGLEYLRPLGVDWSWHPTEDEARRELEQVRSKLQNRTIEELVSMPLMTDPESLATLNVLIRCASAASLADTNLYVLLICRAVDLSLERGVSDASCYAFAFLGVIACVRFGDFGGGFQLGQLGYELVERRGLKDFQQRAYMNFGIVTGWTRRFSSARDLFRRAFDAANRTGDLAFATWIYFCDLGNLLLAGDSLVEVQREAEHGFAFARKIGVGRGTDATATQLALVKTLRGLTRKFGSFDDDRFEEQQIERRFSGNPNLGRAEFCYWV